MARAISEVRCGAFRDLGFIAKGYPKTTEQIVPLLITALKDNEAGVKITVIYCLAEIGRDAKDAVPALRAALDENAGIRTAVQSALKKIEGAK